jgi:hypothetical protein
MEQLAGQGNGSYTYIDTMAEAEKRFVDLTATLKTIHHPPKNPQLPQNKTHIFFESLEPVDPPEPFVNN